MEDFKSQANCNSSTSESSTASAPEKKKSKLKKYLLSGAFLLLLTAVTFYVIFKGTSIDEIWELLKNVKLPYVFAGILAMLAYIVVQGVIIGMAARCIKVRFRLWEMVQYSFIGFFYSGITPSSTGGQPMQFYYMCRDRMSTSNTTLVMFITNITYQISVVLIGLFMLIAKFNFVISVRSSIIIFFILGLSVNLFVLLVLAGVLFSESLLRRILTGIVSFLCKLKIIRKPKKALKSIDRYLEEFGNGVKLIKANPRRFLLTLFTTIIQLLLYHIIPFFVYKAFGLSAYSFFDCVAISAVLYVSVSMLPLPGSVGAAESGFVLLFGPLFANTIMPAMLVSRFINFYTMMILSGCVAVYTQFRKPYNLSKSSRLNL